LAEYSVFANVWKRNGGIGCVDFARKAVTFEYGVGD
jgi:hypothetical protein